MQEERTLHEAKLAKMEAEMNLVFQQKVAEKEAKLKQSEEELYARHKEMKEALNRQRQELEDKKVRVESGGRLTPENKVHNLCAIDNTVYSLIVANKAGTLQFTHIIGHIRQHPVSIFHLVLCYGSPNPFYHMLLVTSTRRYFLDVSRLSFTLLLFLSCSLYPE